MMKRRHWGRAQARDRGRNKSHFCQIGHFGNFFRYAKMTVMNGIKCSTENTSKPGTRYYPSLMQFSYILHVL